MTDAPGSAGVDELLGLSDASDEDLYDDGTDIIDIPGFPAAPAQAPPSRAFSSLREPALSEVAPEELAPEFAPEVRDIASEPFITPEDGAPELLADTDTDFDAEEVEQESESLLSELDADEATSESRERDETAAELGAEHDDIEEEQQSLLSEELEPEPGPNAFESGASSRLSEQLEEELRASLGKRAPAPTPTREMLLEALERGSDAGFDTSPDTSEEEPTHRLRVDSVGRQPAPSSNSLADELAPSLSPSSSERTLAELRPSLADELEPDEASAGATLQDLVGALDPARSRASKVPASISPRAAGSSSRTPTPAAKLKRRGKAQPRTQAREGPSRTAKSKSGTAGATRPRKARAPEPPGASVATADRGRVDPVFEAPTTPAIRGVSLQQVRGLEDLPEESQLALSKSVRRETLQPDEELNGFAVALVLHGKVSIRPAVADAVCAQAGVGDVVFTQGHLAEGIVLRVVASVEDTEVAYWDAETLAKQIADCPWVEDDLRSIADRFQALAGVTMGSLGERLDDTLRTMVTDRCQVVALRPGETLLEQGAPVNGMYVLGAGRLELLSGQNVQHVLNPGDFLFPAQVVAGGGAPHTARAAGGGALLLRAERMTAHELLVSVPPLLEILAQ